MTKKIKFKTIEEYYKESQRYYKNAKETLKSVPVESNRYQDVKPVREACATCYLAVLLALDGYFLERGLDKENLPISTIAYEEYLRKYIVHNGKIKNAFYTAYESLHVVGYYRGSNLLTVIKEGFSKTKLIIDTLSKNNCHSGRQKKMCSEGL